MRSSDHVLTSLSQSIHERVAPNPSDTKKGTERGCWALSSEPGRQALARGVFISAKIFQMLLQCCSFWFGGQGECVGGTALHPVELLLDGGRSWLRCRGNAAGLGAAVSRNHGEQTQFRHWLKTPPVRSVYRV